MVRIFDFVRPGLALAVATLTLASSGAAQSAEELFYEAYYLHHEKGDLNGALALYEKAANSRRASDGLRDKARAMMRDVSEELASSDFASLVPEDTIFYLELNRPGEQMRKLLDQLGLLNGDRSGGGNAPFGVSPKLIEGMLGMRGAAVALTEIHPQRGPTGGVVILHPGDLDVIHGMLETALPMGGTPAEAIGGYPTWNIDNQAWVTMTSQLVIASPQRSDIADVVAKLGGESGTSLATNGHLAGAMGMRGDDVLFFCANLEPVMPMIMAAVQEETRRDPAAQAALAFLDIQSMRSIAGRAGVDDGGMSFDLALDLDEGHRNLVFNLLRMPNLDNEALAMVPAGSAFFAAASLNTKGSVPAAMEDARGRPIVTMMDFGTELFANVTSVALYAMPDVSPAPWGPMPQVALAMGANDVERSAAMWDLLLGTAQKATGGPAEPERSGAGAASIARYEIQGVPVFVATHDDRVVVSPSEEAIAAAMGRRVKTVLDDPVYAEAIAEFGTGSTRGMALNLGRCSEIAQHFMSERERREMAPFAELARDTTLALNVQHTTNSMGVSGRLAGIPNVGPMISQLVEQELHGGRRAMRARPRAGVAYAADSVEAAEASDPRSVFDRLHHHGETASARKVVERIHRQSKNDPRTLNDLAWALLTEDVYSGQYDDVAMAMAHSANEASEWSNWYYLDTYATALFRHGKFEEAVKVQRRAVEAGASDPRIGEAQANLERFVEAAKKARGTAAAGVTVQSSSSGSDK